MTSSHGEGLRSGRTFHWVARVVLWLPVVGMGIVCALYLWQTLPRFQQRAIDTAVEWARDEWHIPIQFGEIRFDLRRGQVLARNVFIGDPYSPDRYLVAAREVTVSNLFSRQPDIQVTHAMAHAVRLPDGRWNFSPLLPKRRRPPAETFWNLRITDGTLRFEDHKLHPPLTATVQQLTGEIRSSAGVSAFHFTHGDSDLGLKATVSGWLHNGHLRLRIDAARVPVSKLLAYTKNSSIDAGDALTDGTVWVYTDLQRRIQYAGKASVRAPRLRWRSPQGTLVVNNVQGDGVFLTGIASWRARASMGSGQFAAAGVVRWAPKTMLDLRMDARGIPFDQLRPWLRRYAPQVRRLAPVDAQLAVRGSLSQPTVYGTVRTARAIFQSTNVQELSAKVVLNKQLLRITEAQVRLAGGTVRAQVAAWKERKEWQLAAHWTARDVNLARMRPYLPADVTGLAHGEGLVYGSLAKPTVLANLRGERLTGRLWRFEQAEARVEWTPGRLTIHGAILEDWTGSGYVAGELNMAQKRLNLRLRLDEVLLSPWVERLSTKMSYDGEPPSAWLYARGELHGTFSEPVFRGVVEATDLQWQQWTADYLVARVEASPENVLVSAGIVRRPPMEVQWQARLQHPLDGKKAHLELDGIANNVDAQEVLIALRPPEAASDAVPLEAVGRVFFHVSGNLRSPTADLTLSAPTVQFRDWNLTAVNGAAHFENGSLKITTLTGRLGDGQLRAQGERDREGRLAFRIEGENLPLGQIQPLLPENAPQEVGGTASLRAEVTGTDAEPKVQVEIATEDATVDVLKALRGYAHVQWQNGEFIARDVHLTNPELELTLHTLQMDTTKQTIEAHGAVSISSLTALSQRALESPWMLSKAPRVGEILREIGQLSGSATLPFHVSGNSNKPSIDATLSVQDLQVDRRELGSLLAQVQRNAEGTWVLTSASLANGEHRLVASGSYRADDTVSLSAEAYNFDLSWFQRWIPQATELRGRLEMATVEVSGASSSPDITLTMALQEPQLGGVRAERVMTGKIQLIGQKLNISELVLAQRDGSLRIWGTLPFRWKPFGVPDDEPMDLRAEASPQPITALLQYLPAVQVGEATGQWWLKARLAGTRAAPQFSGEMSLHANTLRFDRLKTGLRDMRALLQFENHRIRLLELSALGNTPRGGRIAATGEVAFGGTEQERVDISLRLERFWLDEQNLSGQYGEQLHTFLDGEIRLTGNAESPQVAGMIIASNGALVLPSSFPEQRVQQRPLPVNPRFANVVLRIGDGMWLNSARLSAQASGDVVLSGSLQEPVIHGQLGLERGYVYFPTARFRLEPGGTIAVDYPVPGETPFRVNVNVQANTSLSFASPTGTSRRYNVTVSANGSITSPEGLKTEFHSDPPDLSTQQIARALGVGTLEELLTGRNMEQVLQREVVNLFTSAYVPQVFSPLERGIEEALQLREFRIEYDRSEPVTVTLVKRLWDGFSLSYWRTVSAQQDRYILKILYELPEWTRLSRRLSLSFSVDEKQQTRWGIEGSFRF